MSPALHDALREASDWRSNKLTSSEHDETTWSARTWMTFVAQRISVAMQLSLAQEVAEGGRPARAVNRPVVGLGTDDDFSLLASACRGHLMGVCLHDVSVYAVALAVVVVVRR